MLLKDIKIPTIKSLPGEFWNLIARRSHLLSGKRIYTSDIECLIHNFTQAYFALANANNVSLHFHLLLLETREDITTMHYFSSVDFTILTYCTRKLMKALALDYVPNLGNNLGIVLKVQKQNINICISL